MNDARRIATQWFCQHKGRIIGPLTSEELREGVAKGHVTPDTLVRKGPNGEWVNARTIGGLFVNDTRKWADDPLPSHTPSGTTADTLSNSAVSSLDDLLGAPLAANSAARPLAAPLKSSYRTLQERKSRKRIIRISFLIFLLFAFVIVLGVASNFIGK